MEMMNLTGDGTGLDMVTMPQAMREQVPTSNFFQRSGYERNPVAIRNNTVANCWRSPIAGWTATAICRAPRILAAVVLTRRRPGLEPGPIATGP